MALTRGPKNAAVKAIAKVKVKKEAVGQRGKNAEKEVTKVLEAWNNLATFAFDRLPDARMARGRMKSALSDFLVWHYIPNGSDEITLSIPLEVKSTEHDYRLTKAALEQLPRLKKVSMAGAYPVVLVYFKGIDKWRVAQIDFFEYGLPSWDMSELPVFDTPDAALQSTGLFPTGTTSK
jgi:hypothetical protein